MNYIKTIFNKNIDQLKFKDIEDFFVDEKIESTTLEFKSFSKTHSNFEKDLEAVIRGICALLNTEGGILIWGAPNGIKSTARKEIIFKGSLSPVNTYKEKDWIINKVCDSISPLPIGIKVRNLKQDSDNLYLFEVQKSNYRPHQYKHIYWVRLDGQTKPAPHFLVEALFKQIKFPNIEGYLKPLKIYQNVNNIILDLQVIIFNWSELQNEEKVFFRLLCPQGIILNRYEGAKNVSIQDNHYLSFDDFAELLHFGAPQYQDVTIIFTPSTRIVDILLTFGGRYSPFKVSDYTLDLSKMDLSNQDLPNYLFTNINENVISSEKQKLLGANKKDTLKKLLLR